MSHSPVLGCGRPPSFSALLAIAFEGETPEITTEVGPTVALALDIQIAKSFSTPLEPKF